MKALEVPQAIVLTTVAYVDFDLVLETNCRDYDHYTTLPEVVNYQGVECGKTGWNSDRHYACYKASAHIAKAVKDETLLSLR